MNDPTTPSAGRAPLAHLHATFLAILPRIEQHGQIYFRHVKCSDRKQDLLAEMRALCWKWFLRLTEKGTDVTTFVSALATYAAKAVRSGRRVVGHEKARDALSPVAQQRHGFAVGKLPDFSTLDGNPLEEALHDNTVSPVPDQVAFRSDFPAWTITQTERDRRLIDQMMVGERTKALSDQFGISAARVSQKRREFHLGWSLFTADAAL